MKAGWQIKPLAELCEVFGDGDWIESKDQSADGVRLIQTGNVGEGVFKDRGEKARYISEETFKRLRCTEIFEGDCLISRLPDPAGRSCILPDTGERMITAVDCTIVRFNTKQALPEFFNYYTQSRDYLSTVDGETTGTTRKRISRSKLAEVPIPVPPLPEQQRIVTLLDEAFDGIATAKANAEKNLQNARAIFESYLQSVFTQRGDGWNEHTLGETYDVRDGTHDSPKYHDKGFPLITSKNLKRDGLSFDDVRLIDATDYRKINERSAVHKGDVLLAMIGTIGNPVVVEMEPEFAIKNVALLKVPAHHNSHFLRYYLSSQFVVDKMQSEAKGTTQKFVGLGYLRSFPIMVPSSAVQDSVVYALDNLAGETNRLEEIYQQKLTALDELKNSLLHRAFNGDL